MIHTIHWRKEFQMLLLLLDWIRDWKAGEMWGAT
jgi:hypothetical protein